MPVAIGVTAALFGVGYALYGLFRHWHFGSSAFDLGIFDQAVWHLSRLELPASTIKGVSNLFGDHFHPVIALFAPLYWIASGPETLIAAQAALLAASIIPVFLYLRDRLPPAPPTHSRSPTRSSGGSSARWRSMCTRWPSRRSRSRQPFWRCTGGAGDSS